MLYAVFESIVAFATTASTLLADTFLPSKFFYKLLSPLPILLPSRDLTYAFVFAMTPVKPGIKVTYDFLL